MVKLENREYAEDELVQYLQSGEIGYLDYVLHKEGGWSEDYREWLENNGLPVTDETAYKYVEYMEDKAGI